jgi:hypothetical protein
MTPIRRERFEALAGYTRTPQTVLYIQEAAWFEEAKERLLGLVTWDRLDRDYGWIVLARDQRRRFRAILLDVSLPSFEEACEALAAALSAQALLPDEAYHQGDEQGPPIDFFARRAPAERLHPTFLHLHERRWSPARELIAAMMPYHEDADGNFIEQFQTTAFDARLWELYLYASFTELGYARNPERSVPDFVLQGPRGSFAVEATTANPPQGASARLPTEPTALRQYLENYVPIKLARALKRKLFRQPPYWVDEGLAGLPFVIALQDFHAPAAMVSIVPNATEYVFGVRHSIVDGRQRIEWIDEHVFGQAREKSGFFSLHESENVSAVLLNPLGTITKFNRMGYLAGFGDRAIRMVRSGIARGELDESDPGPKPFIHDVSDPTFRETWVEGSVVLHNPNARNPLDPALIPGVAHEFLQPDGRIMSMLPDFQPYMSQTTISLDDDNNAPDERAAGK